MKAIRIHEVGGPAVMPLEELEVPHPRRWSRPLPKDAKPTTITVSKDTAGRYFVSFLVEEEITPWPVRPQMVGIDLHETHVLCVESLRVRHLLKHHALAKAIADVGWGELIRQLQYKAAWYGRSVVVIDKWYPSSQRCYDCGHILDSLSLDVRVWSCPACGVTHDRDINAALKLQAAGLAVFACGETVRPGRAKPVKARLDEAGSSQP